VLDVLYREMQASGKEVTRQLSGLPLRLLEGRSLHGAGSIETLNELAVAIDRFQRIFDNFYCEANSTKTFDT